MSSVKNAFPPLLNLFFNEASRKRSLNRNFKQFASVMEQSHTPSPFSYGSEMASLSFHFRLTFRFSRGLSAPCSLLSLSSSIRPGRFVKRASLLMPTNASHGSLARCLISFCFPIFSAGESSHVAKLG